MSPNTPDDQRISALLLKSEAAETQKPKRFAPLTNPRFVYFDAYAQERDRREKRLFFFLLLILAVTTTAAVCFMRWQWNKPLEAPPALREGQGHTQPIKTIPGASWDDRRPHLDEQGGLSFTW